MLYKNMVKERNMNRMRLYLEERKSWCLVERKGVLYGNRCYNFMQTCRYFYTHQKSVWQVHGGGEMR